jgi:hypothetical protein
MKIVIYICEIVAIILLYLFAPLSLLLKIIGFIIIICIAQYAISMLKENETNDTLF